MIGEDQRRSGIRANADLVNPDADQSADNAMVEMRDPSPEPKVEENAGELERHQD